MRRQQHRSGPIMLLMLLRLLLLLPVVRAIEIKWTPADGEGPMPASKKYRDAMARQQEQQQGGGGMSEEDQLRMMQQMMMQQQQGQRPPPSFLERLLLAGYMAVGGTVAIAQRHPKAAATLSLTAVAGLGLRRAARRNGLLLTRRPHYWTLLEPPVEFLAGMLEEELPAQIEKEEGLEAVTAFQGTVSVEADEGDGDGDDGKTARRSVKVGTGEAAYRKAATLVRTLSLLDALAAEKGPSVGRLYCSERMREGLFLTPRPGGSGWSIGPVAIRQRAGRLSPSRSKKTKGKKGKGKKGGGVVEEAYEEVVLRALPGCAWGRGAELRLAASWRDPAQGGDDAVYLSTAWYTPSTNPPRGLVPPKAAFLNRVCEKAAAMVEQEMAILRVRERQQRQLAEDALKAAAERKRKERQAILNPPPDKKKWKKQHMSGGSGGGQQGPARWQPSSDLQARRNPRRGG